MIQNLSIDNNINMYENKCITITVTYKKSMLIFQKVKKIFVKKLFATSGWKKY